MILVSRLAATSLLLALAACNSLPPYTPAAGEKTVRAEFIGGGRPSICVAKQSYSLPLVEEKGKYFAQLPVDQRVMIFAYQSFQGYQVTSSCHAALSLIPQAGKQIVVNSGLVDGKCFVESVLVDGSTPSGLALDPSVGPPQC